MATNIDQICFGWNRVGVKRFCNSCCTVEMRSNVIFCYYYQHESIPFSIWLYLDFPQNTNIDYHNEKYFVNTEKRHGLFCQSSGVVNNRAFTFTIVR